MLALLAGSLACTQALADDWRYRVRPGDTVWDLSRKYLRPDVPWQRLQAHNGVEDPQALVPGSVFRIPVAWLRRRPAEAVVVALTGPVEASASGRFHDAAPAVEGMRLAGGSALRTGPGASLTVELADGSRLQVQADSELHFDQLSAYGATGMVDTRLRLPRGRASHSVRPSRGPASRYVVDMPGMSTSVRGTEFRVASEDGRPRAEVLEGRVQAQGGPRRVLLAEGRGTTLDAAGHARPATALLPAADLSQWPRELHDLPARLSWPAVEGAQGYRLQASAHEDFRTLLQDESFDTAEAWLRLREEGPVFVRVRAIDAQGLEGRDAQATMLVAAQPAPPFAIAPADGGHAEAPRPRLQWSGSADPARRYRVEVAGDAGFASPLAAGSGLRGTRWRVPVDLPPGRYAWRVGSIDATGREGPWSDPQPFELHAPGEGPSTETSQADGVLQLRWRGEAEGVRYQVQVARDAAFERGMFEREVDGNSVALEGLRAGTWHVRVRALEDDGHAHPWGPTEVVKTGCLPCRILAGAGAAAVLLLVL